MTLIDAGPLIALNNQQDPSHGRCRAAFDTIRPPRFLTTWPCIAEAMYVLGTVGGFARQKLLWKMVRNRQIQIVDLVDDEIVFSASLMEKYHDLPMDLADATLIAVADIRGWRKVFTLDTHFFAYRLRDGSPLEVIIPTE